MTPDPKSLYVVTGVVFAGVLVWLAMMLRTFKEPWARAVKPAETPKGASSAAEAVESSPENGA